ncbi:MAG: PKD domain-containing protein, partial [Bacteroidota bacterium]
MKKITFFGLLISFSLSSYSRGNESYKNNYSPFFTQSYIQNPNIPKGLLEAVSYTKTHFRHIQPDNESPSCIGLPAYYGVMGLIKDGKGFFNNTLYLVSEKSGIDEEVIINNPEMNIKAFALAFNSIQNELNIISSRIEDNIPVLIQLNELPANTDGHKYAVDSYVYSVLSLLNDNAFMKSCGYKPYNIDIKSVFGENNFKVLSSKKVKIQKEKISGNNNSTYSANSSLSRCLDYPLAIWNPADASNYSSRAGTPISAITIHTVQGSYAGCISWFQNPSANVSTHYVMRSSDGQVTQMVCEADKGWHVGSENPYTIGYEHEGYVSDPSWYTTAMYTSSADVTRDILNDYGINPLRTAFWPWAATTNYNSSGIPGSCSRVKGHQHYPNQTHTDPGQYWDWDYYFKLINDPPSTTAITTCTGNFYDTGGSGGNYTDDERYLTVISPIGASSVTITFNSFDLESDWDYMYIYDGASVWDPLIGWYTGTTGPGTITSTGGSIAIEFRSDCATIASGWDASWTCTLGGGAPANLQVNAPACSNTDYSMTLSWNNSGSGWFVDISTDPSFTTYWNKPVDWLTFTGAPTGFNDPFSLGALTLQPDTAYYWRIWDGSVHTYGTTFTVSSCPDVTPPSTSISNANTWETTDFTATFTDADAGGSGLALSFYQPLEYNGTEWRANDGYGFFNDNFDSAINPGWTVSTGTWAINSAVINQTDEGEDNSNIYTPLSQNSSEIYLYHWAANMQSGTSVNRRAGLHFFCDDASLPNRGNSYFVYFRVDQDKCQIYKVVSDTWTLITDDVTTVDSDVWYDYKVIFNPSTGEIKAYQNDILVSSWTDASPLTSGNYISLRTGNANVLFNDLKVYKARTGSELITVGPASTNDIRYQNPDPSTPSGRIKSIVKDGAENWSSLETLNINVDWTPPADVTVNDGISADIDTICSVTELSANWSASSDPHSDVVKYRYAIGTSPGASDVISWADNGLNTNVTQTNLFLTLGQTYYITVRAENGAGLVSNDISSDGQIPVLPSINFFADTTEITLPDTVINFTDATPGALSWNWSFPGGAPSTSTSQTPTVYYNTAGSYDITLTIIDINGCSATVTYTSYIIVSDPPPAPPIANFTSDITSGCELLTVNFSDASANIPTSWLWTFQGGDITSSTSPNPTVVYSTPGTYAVTLTATNLLGSDSITQTNYITVYPIPIVTLITDQSICEGETITLTASGGDFYLWNNGATAPSISVSPTTTTIYSVTTTANGCISEPGSVTVT